MPTDTLVARTAGPPVSANALGHRQPKATGSSLMGRILHLCGEGLTMLAVVWSVPLVILCVGLPIAAAIKLVLWIVEQF